MDQVQQANGQRSAGAPVPFVRANALTPFLHFLTAIGAPQDRLLRQARIPVQLLDDGESLVSVFSAYRFLELAAQKEGVTDIGVVLGRRVSAFELGAFGATLKKASTLYEYLQIGIRTIGGHSGQTRFRLVTEGDNLRVSQYLSGPPSLGRCIADVYTLVLTMSMLRRFLGQQWSPGEVRLLSGDETLIEDAEIFGGARLITGLSHSSFTVPTALLETRLPGVQAAACSGKRVPLNEGRPMPQDLTSSIRQLVVSLLAEQYPTVQTTAELAGMSARTLQRRLAEAGTRYSDVVADSRFQLASRWLLESDMPVTEIAAALGYEDASNFARAFRRRTGMSPVRFRLGRA